MIKRKDCFSTVKEAYGEDREYPQRKPAPKKDPLMTHDAPFKPSNPPKKGYNRTLDKFPEYKEDPMKHVTRKEKPEEERPKWKPTHNKKAFPMPSVTTNMRNLKTEFPSVFRKF